MLLADELGMLYVVGYSEKKRYRPLTAQINHTNTYMQDVWEAKTWQRVFSYKNVGHWHKAGTQVVISVCVRAWVQRTPYY